MAAGITAFVAGLLFAIGLAVSQMVNPAKVLAFLDIFGDWDPSLAFVMAGAVGVAAIGFTMSKKRAAPLLNGRFRIPTRRDVDLPLIAGAVVFGVGWGLAGLCPGPAITGLVAGHPASFTFAGAMLAGMILYQFARPGGK